MAKKIAANSRYVYFFSRPRLVRSVCKNRGYFGFRGYSWLFLAVAIFRGYFVAIPWLSVAIRGYSVAIFPWLFVAIFP